MKTAAIALLSVFLLAAGTLLAQDGASTPSVPAAPYAKEDTDALEALLKAARAASHDAKTILDAAQAAANEEGLPDEVKATRVETLRAAEEKLKLAEAEVVTLEAAVKDAKAGPTRAQLDARREYDRLLAHGAQAQLDLIADPAVEEGRLEGSHAKAIREAEEELARLARLSVESGDFAAQKGRLYERLSELDKVDYELRWAEERLALSKAEYDQLMKGVYGSYIAYETRALTALRNLRHARDVLWPLFRGSAAETMLLPEAARPTADVNAMLTDIERRLDRRRGRVAADRLQISAFDGRLRRNQDEIDIREDFMERLTIESERLKDLLASQPVATKEAAQNGTAAPSTEQAEYQKLGRTISDLERTLKDNLAELERLKRERERLLQHVQEKDATEKQVSALVAETEKKLAALEALFEAPEDAPEAERRRIDRERALYYPFIAVLALSTELDAQRERESSAKRDTLQARSQVEVIDRRTERLQARSKEIVETLLPAARDAYWSEIGRTAGERALKVLAIILLALMALWGIRRGGTPLMERFVRKADRPDSTSADDRQRARTLMTVFMTTAKVVVYILGLMFVVSQFDVDYGPLLVAAGGLSLAVGFGAQTLVKDFFSGFFVLLEGQFSIGDVVEINGKVGTVENLNLRTTVLRSVNGDVHVVPNGEIKMTSNRTRTWSRAVIDIGVAYEEDAASVIRVLDGVAQEMRADENWGRKVIEHTVVGVEDLGESSVVIRVLLKTRAGEQWGAAREYRLRAKTKFDELGIEIPWPQRVVTEKQALSGDEREQSLRGKRARILRYVRKSQGDLSEEEIALATLSVEERDRAKAMANHKVTMATEDAAVAKDPAAVVASAAAAAMVVDEAKLSDAEVLARKLAAEKIAKQEVEAAPADQPEKKEPK